MVVDLGGRLRRKNCSVHVIEKVGVAKLQGDIHGGGEWCKPWDSEIEGIRECKLQLNGFLL